MDSDHDDINLERRKPHWQLCSNRIMSWDRLPQELIEAIFDHLRQDKRALKVCSLVCKAWLHPAYRRLFYVARLYSSRLIAAYDPTSKSIAAPFIRRLRMALTLHQWNDVFPSLDGFPSVTSLTVATTLPWDKILPEIRLTIFNRFHAIVELRLERVITTSFSELAEIICKFRFLESVTLGSTVWRVSSNSASPLLRLPQNLHTLELNRSDFTEILEWLCSFGHDLNLRNVSFFSVREDHCGVVNAFLRVLGPSLESFHLQLVGVNFPLRLDYNTHLRFLDLDVWRGRESKTGLAPLLSAVVSMHMEEVSLNLQYLNHRYYADIPMEWGDVDGILARPQFSNVKTVRVRQSLVKDPPQPLEWFYDRLPLCHGRGILRLGGGKRIWGPF